MALDKDLIDKLLEGYQKPEDLIGENGLLKQLTKALVERALNAELTGNMPASAAGYEYPALADLYEPDLLQLFQDSVDAAAPRSVTPYWSDISSSLQSTWHPPASVDSDTPAESKSFIEQIIDGGRLL